MTSLLLADVPHGRSLLLGTVLACLGGCQESTAPVIHEPVFSVPSATASGSLESTALPFRGTLTSTSEISDDPPRMGCLYSARTDLVGELTHLGRFEGVGTVCVLFVDVGVSDPPGNPGGGAPPFVVSDFEVEQSYTAANGDELRISGRGVLIRSLTDGRSGFTGEGTIEGGTGRFDGAVGSFSVHSVEGTVEYDGWIVAPELRRGEDAS
ncbi:MAG: hypothetical protein R3304_09695 [Longimicrobiales bacterium]|nr:hypothetical protein [Longimicrobiales bacterium]